MIIKEDYTYSSKDVADAFNLDYRKVTRLAKREGIPIVGKGYQFSGKFLMKHFKISEGNTNKNVLKVTSNVLEVTNKKTFNDYLNQPHKSDKTLALLEHENETLKAQIIELKERLLEFDKKPNEKVEALTEEIQELKEELSIYDIAENERLEVYTETAYAEFEKRLKEYPIQKKTIQDDKNIKRELETELKVKDVRLEGTKDLLQLHKDGETFWKSQSKYKDEQNEKMLKMHSILVESVSNYSKQAFIESTVKARNTDWTKKKDKK